MANLSSKNFVTMLLIFLILPSIFSSSQDLRTPVRSSAANVDSIEETNLETYIVLLQKPDGKEFADFEEFDSWYDSFLPDSKFSSGEPRILHSYHHAVTGFAAKLTADEVMAMKQKEGFISARPRRMVPLHTTHTPTLLGLDVGLWNMSDYGKGVIIGLIDTGIAADHPSFSGDGMPPPPSKWKGKCDNATLCNNKLIGTRNFDTTSNDTSDDFMHGTHTASTAAGSPVLGASYYGQANGTAIGMAPLAHLAMYKVSGRGGEAGENEILAAMDAAIEDNVDVLSLSLGIGSHPFYDDVVALGAYAAIKKGIFVSCSAGNSGPDNSSLSNEAPWILTVGASTIDRSIRAIVLIGHEEQFIGESLYQPKDFPSTLVSLVYPGANGNRASAYCEQGSLRDVDVKGKIVLCDGGSYYDIPKGQEVKDNGGVAMILVNENHDTDDIEPQFHVLPASQVLYVAGQGIKVYLNSTSSPTATISFKGTVTGLTTGLSGAPHLANFSSRGPSLASPGILKPDIIGPGVRVLAAWPVSVDNSNQRFAMISGTSMSCPHLAGIAALLKSLYPNWSPAAIKSAIITTGNPHNLEDRPITDQEFDLATVFDMGAGQVNPSAASKPGLIYDIQPEDYIPYLCGLGYSDQQVGLIVQAKVSCSKDTYIPEAQLNYPSFSIKLGSTPQTYTRTVTNVGEANSTYTLEIEVPRGVYMKVTPDKLSFSEMNQKATYSVTFSREEGDNGSFGEGYLNWVADRYHVSSPIAVILE
ncbi:Subtilisin-like protease [Euphorbia peplus]|nr:Subtilisin-like protease [Euphorbia peplus]